MIHSAFYNTLHYSGFLCWPCKNGHSKHHFVNIFVYECGCQGYLYIFLLRTALRSAQILIFKKKGRAQWFWTVSANARGQPPDPNSGFQSSASKTGHNKHLIFIFGTYFHLWQDIWWRTSISWPPVQFTCEGYLYSFFAWESFQKLPRPGFPRKIVLAQWILAVSAYSRDQPPDLNSGFLSSPSRNRRSKR